MERNIENSSFNQNYQAWHSRICKESRRRSTGTSAKSKTKLQQVKEQDNPDKKALQEIDAMQRQLNQDLQDLSLGIDELFQDNRRRRSPATDGRSHQTTRRTTGG